MRPYDAKTEADLGSDNFPQDSEVWSMLHNGETVSLHPPAGGETFFVSIPRDQFNAIVDWYMAEQESAP